MTDAMLARLRRTVKAAPREGAIDSLIAKAILTLPDDSIVPITAGGLRAIIAAARGR